MAFRCPVLTNHMATLTENRLTCYEDVRDFVAGHCRRPGSPVLTNHIVLYRKDVIRARGRHCGILLGKWNNHALMQMTKRHAAGNKLALHL